MVCALYSLVSVVGKTFCPRLKGPQVVCFYKWLLVNDLISRWLVGKGSIFLRRQITLGVMILEIGPIRTCSLALWWKEQGSEEGNHRWSLFSMCYSLWTMLDLVSVSDEDLGHWTPQSPLFIHIEPHIALPSVPDPYSLLLKSNLHSNANHNGGTQWPRRTSCRVPLNPQHLPQSDLFFHPQ